MGQKEGIERDIAARMARLDAPGQPGLDEPLVDPEVRTGSGGAAARRRGHGAQPARALDDGSPGAASPLIVI